MATKEHRDRRRRQDSLCSLWLNSWQVAGTTPEKIAAKKHRRRKNFGYGGWLAPANDFAGVVAVTQEASTARPASDLKIGTRLPFFAPSVRSCGHLVRL